MQSFTSYARRVLGTAGASLMLSGLLVAGGGAVAVADAEAALYCGQYKDGHARTSTRYSRVRVQACQEVVNGQVRGVNRTTVDKPTGCTWGAGPSGPSYTCPPSAASGWAEFHGFQFDIEFFGWWRCTMGYKGASAMTYTCASGNWKPRGDYTTTARTCYDVKDDGNPWICTEYATFRYIS